MLECNGVVKPLPVSDNPSAWSVQVAQGSMIPFVTDGKVRHWAMSIFQTSATSGNPQHVDQTLPDLDLDSILPADPAAPQSVAPIAPLPGMTPQSGTLTAVQIEIPFFAQFLDCFSLLMSFNPSYSSSLLPIIHATAT